MTGRELHKQWVGKTPRCVAPGCINDAVHVSPGVGPTCKLHYQRLYRHGTFDNPPRPLNSAKPEYRHWINMRSRCNTPSSTNYSEYGGRGIRVFDKWNKSFDDFLADVGRRPTNRHSIDRIDVDGNYEPGNVRWATPTQQLRNTRRNRLVNVDGVQMTLADAVERSDLLYNTVLYRLKRGWTIEQALGLALQNGAHPK